jgi:hypothetical protein
MSEAPLGEFSASLGMLLGSIKLDDDGRDGASPLSVLGNWLLKRRFSAAAAYFEGLDPLFDQRVKTHIANHLSLEVVGSVIPIELYSKPTGDAFAYTFGLMSQIEGMAQYSEALHALGQQVGRAIIAFDCAVDWKRDQ